MADVLVVVSPVYNAIKTTTINALFAQKENFLLKIKLVFYANLKIVKYAKQVIVVLNATQDILFFKENVKNA